MSEDDKVWPKHQQFSCNFNIISNEEQVVTKAALKMKVSVQRNFNYDFHSSSYVGVCQ
jgi:hypothetical protein